MHKNKIPYYESHEHKMEGERNGIHMVTFHSIKGLEFKSVFLIDVNNRTSPKLPYNFDSFVNDDKMNYIQAEKSFLYMACSRAIENLIISGIGIKSEMIRLYRNCSV